MAGNLALDLLGLPAIPGSCLNDSQQLKASASIRFSDLYPFLDPDEDADGNGLSNFYDYAVGGDPLTGSTLEVQPQMVGQLLEVNRRTNAVDLEMGIEISSDLMTWYPLTEGVAYLVETTEAFLGGERLTLEFPMLPEKSFFRQSFTLKSGL